LGVHGKIFVSYRREDAPGDARSICDRLTRSFGAANVFMDVDRLLAGQRFDRELDKALAKCDVLIAVIGSRWTELLSDHARHGTRDYVCDEIAAALQRDIIVIPVMIGREANMPPLPLAQELPENIRELVLYQKHNVAHESFVRDANHLITAIKAALREKRGPKPWRAMAAAAAIVLALTVGTLGYWMNVIPRFGPSVTQRAASDQRMTATSNSDLASSRIAAESAKQKAEVESKAEQKAGAEAKAAEEASKARAASEAAAKTNASNEAARKEAQLANVTDCDRLAVWPYDDDRPNGVAGVLDTAKIDAAATVACNDAMLRYPDVARFVYQAGRAAYARKDYARAKELFRAASAKGSAAALFGLGAIYANAAGVARDYDAAREWYEQAAAGGNSAAMNNLGQLYEIGIRSAPDYFQARRWYERAVGLGNAFAMNNLAVLYENARGGLTRDYAAARKLYEQAAALGNTTAMTVLGDAYYGGRDGVAVDYDRARDWYEKAAAGDDSEAMNELGYLYYQGRAGKPDYETARAWFERAAGLGNVSAMLGLGFLYEKGHGVAKDSDQARRWYQKAMADAGNESLKASRTSLR
jgi:TPR repeat protein